MFVSNYNKSQHAFKSMLIFFLLMLPLITFAKKKSSAYQWVTIQVTQTSSYCGGAAPSEEILQELKKPSPFPRKMIYLKLGTKNTSKLPILDSAITDELGRVKFKIKKGSNYCVLESWKAWPYKKPEPIEFIQWDYTCLQQAYEKADLLLKAGASFKNTLQLNYHKSCFYNPFCGNYSGPLPP